MSDKGEIAHPVRRGQQPDSYLEDLAVKLEKNGNLGGRPIHVAKPGDEKMSEVFEAFIEPYLDTIEGLDPTRKLVMLGVVAWNAALMQRKDRRALVRKLLDGLPGDETSLVASFVNQLIRRKKTHFGDCRRAIAEAIVRETADGLHLTVLSTPAS
ncbi:hypothetical protein CMK11_08540 [Candidatus Poribacteria bacterium]|jgi:hypothetical protein|nr:hypothetical protein [Candidatus Poribacteria bacterium]